MTEKSSDGAFWTESMGSATSTCETDLPRVETEVLRLHTLLHRQLTRYIVSRGLNITDAEDVVQESFLELYRHLLANRSRENLPGWLFRVAHRTAVRRRRRHLLQFLDNEADLDCYAATMFTPEEEALLSESHRKLRNIFLALPEQDKCCLQLRSEGMSYRDIAKTLKISLGSAHKSLARSFDRLQLDRQK